MTGAIAADPPGGPAGSAEEGEEFVPGEVIVRFSPDSTREQRRATLTALDPRASEDVEGVAGTRVLDIPRDDTVAEALAELRGRDDVAWAEPNFEFHLSALPNDPLLGQQWGLRNVGQNSFPMEGAPIVPGTPGIDVGAAAAWDRSTGGGRVAVLDTGVEPRNPDIAPNLDFGLSRNFVPEPSLEPDPPVDPGAWADVQGHGTHVAGIVGAVGDNGIGGVGVNWDADIAALRVCGPGGDCATDDIAEAVAYAGDRGIPVANMSLGFSPEESTPGEAKALRQAIAAHPGTLYVVAAGNDGKDVDAEPEYPCVYPLENVVCVAALEANGELAEQAFDSNYGKRSVDLAAPGQYIKSTWVDKIEVFDDFFGEGIGAWEQTPYPWSEGEIEEEPTLRFDGTDEGVAMPVPTAAATLEEDLSFLGQRDCSMTFNLALELHGNQTLAVEAAAEGGGFSPVPPQIYEAGDLEPGELELVEASFHDLDGSSSVQLRFTYRANGTESPLPEIDITSINVLCITPIEVGSPYKVVSGTSMATPFVAGVASLGLSVAPDTGTDRLREALLGSVVPTASLRDTTATGGRVNAANLLDALDPPPGPEPKPDPEPDEAGARLGPLRVTPRLIGLPRGRATRVRAAVRNLGDRPARRFRICLRAPRAALAGPRCRRVASLAPGRAAGAAFRLRATRRTPPRRFPVRVVAAAPGVGVRIARAALRVLPRRVTPYALDVSAGNPAP